MKKELILFFIFAIPGILIADVLGGVFGKWFGKWLRNKIKKPKLARLNKGGRSGKSVIK